MTPRVTRTPSFGTETGGVRYNTPPRHDLRAQVSAYAPTGWENAPIEPIRDEFDGRYALLSWAGVVLGSVVFWVAIIGGLS